MCPGLCTERYTLSPSQLRQHGKIVRSYSPTELLRMQLENRSSVVLSGTTTEYFLDIACMGSEEVWHTLSFLVLLKKSEKRREGKRNRKPECASAVIVSLLA